MRKRWVVFLLAAVSVFSLSACGASEEDEAAMSAMSEKLETSVSFEKRSGSGFLVETEDGPRNCRALVLAPGSAHRRLGLEGEEELTGQGVSYCAVCDGPFYRGRHVAVVGGGDTALQDALFLAGVCRQVVLVHRSEQFRAEARLVQRLRERDNVELLLGCIEKNQPARTRMLEAELVFGESVAERR